jgi:hypothetical protein
MNNLTSTSDNLIKTRLAEADVYCSQGLDEEARLICLELLKLTGDQSHPLHTEIESRQEKRIPPPALKILNLKTLKNIRTINSTVV